MKTFIFSLIAAAALCMPVQAKERTVTERDSLGNTKRIIELLDTVRDGQAVTDTLSITTYDNPTRHKYSVSYDADDFFHVGMVLLSFRLGAVAQDASRRHGPLYQQTGIF